LSLTALYSKLPFDPVKDFAPIGLVGSTALVLAVTASLPEKPRRKKRQQIKRLASSEDSTALRR
jgi:tripartite-type tricarboxylate transporter receptor subunit TctC